MPIPEDAASKHQANALLGRLLAGERVDLPYAPPRAAADPSAPWPVGAARAAE